MNLSVYRRQDFFALNNYIADVIEEIIPGRCYVLSINGRQIPWTSGRQIQILPVIFFFFFFAKTVSHNNYLYQITKLKLKP